MELKPGYKQSDLGVIPEDWRVLPLSACSEKITDGEHQTPKRQSSGYYLLSARNIRDGSIDLTDVDYVGEDEYLRIRQHCDPEPGDVLISCSGTVGRVATVSLGLECVMVRSAALVKPSKAAFNGTFLQYFLQSWAGQKQILASLNQGAQANLFQNHIQKLQITLPPTREEQETIATALSNADLLIESLEQLLVKKREIKQGAMQQLLTGKKRLPGFGGKWPEKALGDLFHFSGGLSASRDQLGSEGLCYLHYGDIHSSTKTFVDVRTDGAQIPKLEIKVGMVSPKSLLADGDIVFVDASEDDEGASRHVVILNEDGIPFISGLHTIVAKSKTGELNRAYKRYCFQTSAVKSQFKFFAVGTKVSGISKTNIAKLNIPVPEVAEQAAIASILVAMDAEIAALDARLAKARQLKQGMMQELLTGRIRLARPSAQILSFPAKESASATDISHNTHFNEAVVIAVLSARFGSETFPLGRFRRTKFSYLLHRHVEHEAAGFMKKAAGPYNPRTRYGGAEKIALQNRYVRVLSTGKSEGFVADENIAQAEGYFHKWYGAEALTWLEQFRYQKNDALELLTTVDMACEDLSRVGKAATLSAVKQIIHDSPEWKAKLNRAVFSDDNIATTIQSCGQLFPIEEE